MASTSKKDIKRKQLYKKEYTEKWDFIQPSQRGENYARCTLCISDFSIGHSGSYDITQHIETTKHRNIAETKSANRSIRQFMPSNKDYDLIRAETLWTEYVIEHNMPFVSSDEFTDVVKQMFPDSKIASKFSCRRTKTTAIARTLGQQTKDDITHRLRQTRFSLSTEGSSDRGAEEQLYPIVVRYFDENVNRVVGVLLEIATTEKRSTGANIFELLDNALKEKRIPWENCICFSADNASVMMGIHAGVATYVRKQNPDVFVLGCPCHRLHLAAEKGASTLPFTPVDVLIAVFYYLEKSSKRHKELKGVQTLCGTANHKILKHVCTRWLSLEKALNRLLEQWPALLEYFKREAGHGSEKRKNEESSNQPKKQKSNQTKDSESSAAGTSTGRTTTGVHTSSQTKDSESSPAGTSTGVHTSSQTKDSESSPAGTSTGVHTSSRTKDSESSPAGTSTGRTTTGVHTSKSCSGFARAIGAYTRRKLPQIWLPRTLKPSTTSTSKSKPTSKSASKPKPAMKAAAKAEEIHATLADDYNKLYCLFLKQTIPLFTHLNLELQKDEPMVHVLHDKLNGFLKNIMLRFVKPVIIKTSPDLKECQYKDPTNQRPDADLMLGQEVRDFISSPKFSSSQLEEFYMSVRKYFTAVCDYVISTFPLSDELLEHAGVANVNKRLEESFSSVSYFVKRFHFMEDKLDQLEVEFANYQVDDELDSLLEKRADDTWFDISHMKDKASSQLKYQHLPQLMLMILSISHRNAEDERIFSIVRKNATEFRSSLSTSVLSDSLTSKIYWQAAGIPCHSRVLKNNLLLKCKKATVMSNTRKL
ncbi:uncharacterized protein LOC119730226 [Patiria miniata]|uniref:DUF4371 domain-containing protein n=1 Tax=Patiria miniata TaxID=46514 RepID=A0A914A628_PATMI|nr:uncharacterized protein LOC119730226 [Patiria miniata]